MSPQYQLHGKLGELLSERIQFLGRGIEIKFASKVHPETHNQHILVGAEEGIYTLNLNELHENAMDLLYPRRTVWMFVIKDVVMTLSGKTPSLFRHDLVRQDWTVKQGICVNNCDDRWVCMQTPSKTTGSPSLSTPSLKFQRSLSPKSTAWRPR